MSCSYCGKNEVRAKGLCTACYYRKRKTGTLEYQRWHKPKRQCSVEGCTKPHVAKGLCEKHYKSMQRTGETISLFAYGERRKHPLYGIWTSMFRCTQGRVNEWDDFWMFVNSVPEKPEGKYTAKRYDVSLPWSTDNFYWNSVKSIKEQTRSEVARNHRKRNPLSVKDRSLKRQFGISLKDYMDMYDAQDGKCWICGKEGNSYSSDNGRSKTLAVDHCHDSKKIRGLLCNSCNVGLGKFKDNPSLLRKAIKYLQSHS